MSRASTPQVLVVGAGPAGLVLALSLLKHGVHVRIIDKDGDPHIGSRGAGIMPRTLEIFKMLSVLPDYLKLGAPVPQMRSYKLPGGTEPDKTWDLLVKLPPSTARPHTSAFELGQDVSEQILRKHLQLYNCRVEFDTELVSLQQDAYGVTAQLLVRGTATRQETAHFKYLVGADGARGSVRKLIGVSFLGETRDTDEFVVGDVEVENLSPDFWHLWKDSTTKTSPVLGLRPAPPSRNKFSIFSTGNGLGKRDLIRPENFREFFREYTGRDDIKLGRFSWLSSFQPNMRMVDKFSVGKVFLVGDAAHVHSPTGGQGMNSSVQDSFNLAWKLALVIGGRSPETLLSSYHEERLPVIADMLQRTSNVHTKTFGGGDLTGQQNRGWSRGSELLMLDINYRWSPIVLDRRNPRQEDPETLKAWAYGGYGEGLCAGDRAPEAPGLVQLNQTSAGTVTSLFDVFDATRHSLLIFSVNGGDDTAKTLDLVSTRFSRDHIRNVVILEARNRPPSGSLMSRPDTLILSDKDGQAFKNYSLDEHRLTLIVVRPDGVVGAIVYDANGLAEYFSKIFIQ